MAAVRIGIFKSDINLNTLMQLSLLPPWLASPCLALLEPPLSGVLPLVPVLPLLEPPEPDEPPIGLLNGDPNCMWACFPLLLFSICSMFIGLNG